VAAKQEDCWNWQGLINNIGHGVVVFDVDGVWSYIPSVVKESGESK